jgi:hypothetical protein
MGMQRTEANADILGLIEDAEAEIIRQNRAGIKPLVGLEFVRRVKEGLYWSDRRSDDLLFDGLSIGFLLGMTAQGEETERINNIKDAFSKFIRKNKTKGNLLPGEKSPGRKKTEITLAMETLITKIPPLTPYLYSRPAFMSDLIIHYESLKEWIHPVNKGAAFMVPIKHTNRKVTIERALVILKAVAKQKLSAD